MNRKAILAEAKRLTLNDRQATYGAPYDNLTDVAGLFSAYLRGKFRGQLIGDPGYASNFVGFSAEDIAHFNILQKMVRSYQGDKPHSDNYIDMAAYSAIAGECAFYEDEQ